jgi:protein-disulfide isomerase
VTTLSRTLLACLAAPLALGLAACDKAETSGPPSSDEAIAKVAPPAGKSWSEVVEVTPESGYRMGNPDAPIKLVEYGSLSCPHCARLTQEGGQKLENEYVDSGRVSWEFRSFAIHPQDIPLTVLAECAGPDMFFPLVDQIYANFDAMNAVLGDQERIKRAEAASTLPPEQRFVALSDALGYIDFFAQRGVSTDQSKACLADASKAQKVADLANDYAKDGIDSTPTLLINGARLGTGEWTGLEAALQRAGAR